jgi:iron complex transport system substrate-binding protein
MRSPRILLIAGCAALALAGCGSDSGSEAAGASDGEPAGGAFPVTIEHKYGSTTIDSAPTRVVSVGFTDQDFLLALGVTPVGIRDWYGDQPHAVWPWAQDALGDAEPEVLSSEEIEFEKVAALRPDLIVGVSSGMTEDEYRTLSDIAPTITQTDEYVDYGVPWQDGLRMIGKAVGTSNAAEEQIEDIEARFEEIRDAHAEWKGQEGTVSYVVSETEVGAYSSQDTRGRLLTDLGLTVPPEIDALAGDQFYSSFSLEELGRLDRDVILWIGLDEAGIIDRVKAHPLRQNMKTAKEGREIFLTEMQGGAAGFSSPLSLPYLLDTLVPQLEAALDGDPATAVPAPA